MKGDKGSIKPAQSGCNKLTRLSEFAGTLLGFDDYVSEYAAFVSKSPPFSLLSPSAIFDKVCRRYGA